MVTSKAFWDQAPIYEAQQASITRLKFHRLERHPLAFRLRRTLDGRVTQEAAVPRATVERLFHKCEDVVSFYTKYWEEDRGLSLPRNATYWGVPQEALRDPTKDLFAFMGDFDRLDSEGSVLIYQSTYDHRVWDIEGKFVPVPIPLRLGSKQFDLYRVAKHLEGRSDVLSFAIDVNSCRQNWESSGTHHGNLVVDVARLPLGDIEPTRSWLEDAIVHGFHEGKDFLGLQAFRIPEGL